MYRLKDTLCEQVPGTHLIHHINLLWNDKRYNWYQRMIKWRAFPHAERVLTPDSVIVKNQYAISEFVTVSCEDKFDGVKLLKGAWG